MLHGSAGSKVEPLHALTAFTTEFRVFGLEASAVPTPHAHDARGRRRRTKPNIPQPRADGARGRSDRGARLRGQVSRDGPHHAQPQRETADSDQDDADGSEEERQEEGSSDQAESTGSER